MTTELPAQIRQRTVAKARTLLEALPFMREHHGKVIVVKYGGAAMDTVGLASSFAEDIALLQSAGITAVVVHGGGPQVTNLSERLGIETTFVNGLRVTDAETLDVATMVLAGKLNTEVVASLVTGGVRAVGLCVDGGLLLARKQAGPDPGFVGEVVHVNADVLRTLTEQRRAGGREHRGRRDDRAGLQRERGRGGERARDRTRRREAGLHQRCARADRAERRPAERARPRSASTSNPGSSPGA